LYSCFFKAATALN